MAKRGTWYLGSGSIHGCKKKRMREKTLANLHPETRPKVTVQETRERDLRIG